MTCECVEAETYRQMHETARELGYPSILEALEALERLSQPSLVEQAERMVKHFELPGYGPSSVEKSAASIIRRLLKEVERLSQSSDGVTEAEVEPTEKVSLAECPIGLFWSDAGEPCLKTEYGNNDGRIDAYIVSSGEFFWGAPTQSIASQRAQMVVPIDTDAAIAALRSAATSSDRSE